MIVISILTERFLPLWSSCRPLRHNSLKERERRWFSIVVTVQAGVCAADRCFQYFVHPININESEEQKLPSVKWIQPTHLLSDALIFFWQLMLLSKLNERESAPAAAEVTQVLNLSPHSHNWANNNHTNIQELLPLIHFHADVGPCTFFMYPVAQTKYGSVLPPAGWRLHVPGGIHRGAVARRPAEPVRPDPDPGDPHGGGQERGREDQSCH